MENHDDKPQEPPTLPFDVEAWSDGPIPFDQFGKGDRVEIAWQSPQAKSEKTATGRVSDVDVFEGEYAIDDGTPYAEIDAEDDDRDFRVSPVFDGQVESISYETFEEGNATRIGDLVRFRILE